LPRRGRQKESKNAGLDFVPQSIEDFEQEAKKHLDQSQIDYVYRGSESQLTLNRNTGAFLHYLLERRVLKGIDNVDLNASYFDGRIKSELPFFPAPVNCSPLYPNAIIDLLRVADSFSVPVFVSHVAVVEPLELSKLPSLVKNRASSLIWQIYMQTNNIDECYKQARLADSWGYKALTITIDTELNLKLGNELPVQTASHSFISITPKEIRKLRQMSSLPLIVKGLMNADDAELAVESGADGVIVSNHGARMLDHIPSTLEVLPEIVKRLKSKKRTRGTEIFFDGGIRRGTDVLIALALGAKGCLLGRPVLWSLACDHKQGVARMMKILKEELRRAAILCGVSKISNVGASVVRRANF
jgi:isopentenyl diphosphate isomerase/L-lactate dehydrogenase-like FMN-dependent dehydrogenase